MATKLLCLLLVTACAAELGFRPKQQYKYVYEGKQASGIPGIASQWSALGFKMSVIIQVPTVNNLYIQLKDIEYGELQNDKTHQPWRKYLQIPYQPISQFSEYLSEPFKVQMSQGMVSTITTSGQEPVWVVNIKKSIAQLFQLDMQRHQSIQEPTMPQPSSYLSGKDNEQGTLFRVMEGGIGGECETIYETTQQLTDNLKADIVQQLSQHQQQPVDVPELRQFRPFYVTKTKNYQNCRTRPIWQHLTPPAVACRADDCHLTSSNSSAITRFLLDGDHSDFQIQTVVSESENLVYPYGHETEQLWTVTNQTLFLQSHGRMGHFMGEPKQPKPSNTLAFQYPTTDGRQLKFPDLQSEPQISTVMPGVPIKLIKQKYGPQQLVQNIRQMITKVDSIMAHVQRPDTEDVAGWIIEIERALSLLSYQEIKQVYQSMQSESQKDIFYDVLATVGTNPAVTLFVDLVSQNRVPITTAYSVISSWPLTIKTPTPELMTKLVQFYKSSTTQSKPQLRNSLVLSLANIFHQVCVSNVTVDFSYPSSIYGQQFCNDQMETLLKQVMLPFVEQQINSHPEPEKLVYIQALGNIGHKSIIPILSKIFTSPQSSPLTASKAIYGLHHITKQYPETVRSTVSPIYADPTIKTEVRVAALTALIASNPPIAYWQKIAVSTWFEPSEQIVAFIHSAYSSLANNTNAQVEPLFEMSRRARIMLPLIRPPSSDVIYSSRYSYVTELISRYQLASISRISYVTVPESVVPVVFYTEFQHYINSLVHSTGKWVVNLHGIESVIDSLLRSSSQRQSPRDVSTASEILRRISQQLNIQTANAPKDFKAAIYIQLMGAIDRFYNLDTKSVDDLLESFRRSSSSEAHYHQKIMYLEDKTATFPSEIGMPVVYVKKMPLVASVRGQMKVSWNYHEGTYRISLVDAQPFVATKSRVMVSTVSPLSLRILGVGVENNFQVGMPMTFEASLDTQKRTVQVRGALLSQPSRVTAVHLRSMPFTTAVEYNSYSELSRDSKTVEVLAHSPATYNMDFGRSVGINGYLNFAYDSPVINFGTMYSKYVRNGSPSAQFSIWYLMSCLHSRHYDVVIDTGSSPTQSFESTFVYTDEHSSSNSQQMRQPITQSQQHLQQVANLIRASQSSMQQSSLKDYLYGLVAAVTLKQRGGAEVHYTSKFTFAADEQWYTQKLDYEAKAPRYQVCLKTDLQFPRLSESRQALLNDEVKVPLTASLGFGTTCQEHTIQMKGSAERDQIQRQYATQCAEAQRCRVHEQRGYPNSADCRVAKDHAAIANAVNMNFSWNELPTPFRNATYQIDYLAKYLWWPFMSNDPFTPNAPKQLKFQLRYNPYYNYGSAHVLKPFETTKYEGVPMPWYVLNSPYVVTLRKSVSQKLADTLFGVDKSVCIADSQMLKTFDNVTMSRRPSPQCWTLLTKDASQLKNIAILDKLINGKPAVRILVDQSDLQVSVSGSSFQVLVNGQPRPLSQRQPIVIYTSQHSALAYIDQASSDSVVVRLPKHYAEVQITTESVLVYMSPLVYRNKLTGVCSTMNGEVQDEMIGPQGCIFKRPEPFSRSFIVPLPGSSQQCQPQLPRPEQCVRKPRSSSQVTQPPSMW